jgi:hypothetical protein
MQDFAPFLMGKDLRRIKKANDVVQLVQDQASFDALFALLFHQERTLVMRAADAVEKITIRNKQFLAPHKDQLLSLLFSAINKELKWHVAQLVPRLPLQPHELKQAWSILTYWAQNPNESKIVRVNALQTLFDLALQTPAFMNDFVAVLDKVELEPIPSLRARIKKIRKLLPAE